MAVVYTYFSFNRNLIEIDIHLSIFLYKLKEQAIMNELIWKLKELLYSTIGKCCINIGKNLSFNIFIEFFFVFFDNKPNFDRNIYIV